MRSGTATTRRVRLVIVLSVAAAVTVMIGVILVAASLVMRMMTKHQPAHVTRLGLDVVAAGIAFGLVVLVVFAIGRIGGAGRSRPRPGRADHRRGASRPEPAAASRGHGRSAGHGKDRPRAGGQQPGTQQPGGQRASAQRAGAPPAGGHAGRGGGARSWRSPVLDPTNVYSPGGLIDMPGDGRAPGTPGGQDIPEILRTAGPGPAPGGSGPGGPAHGAPAGGRGQDRPPSGWAGPQPPRPGYQPGMNPGGPGRAPYGAGGQPAPPMPPHDHGRPREAPRAGYPMPGRDGAPGREPFPPRGAGPGQNPRDASRPGQAGPRRDPGQFRDPRDQGQFRDPGPGRDSMGPGGPFRPGGPVPPRDPAYPPPGPGHAQDRGAGRHAAGPGYGAPGYAAPGGHRPGAPGHAGAPGQRGPAGDAPFDGGYAKVIRASDHPVRPAGRPRPPGFSRPAEPARPADVYVYRDTGDQPGGSAAAGQGPGQDDAAYWYDLPGSGPGTGAPPQGGEEARGPFEPLVSSSDPPGAAHRLSADAGAAEPAVPDTAHPDPASGDARTGGTPEEPLYDRARKLEQIKDLYLTAEAIGEANVDKHFDQLLAQQRDLISDYFRRSGTLIPAGPPEEAQSADSADRAETDPAARRDPGPPSGAQPPGTQPPGGPATPPEGVRVAADRPRAW